MQNIRILMLTLFYNKTIQEKFEYPWICSSPTYNAFNDKLLDWLILFNETRSHYALGLQSPMQFMQQPYQQKSAICIGGIHQLKYRCGL